MTRTRIDWKVDDGLEGLAPHHVRIGGPDRCRSWLESSLTYPDAHAHPRVLLTTTVSFSTVEEFDAYLAAHPEVVPPPAPARDRSLEPKIRLEVFDQDKTWTSQDGREVDLDTIDVSHRRNLIAFLRRDALRIAAAYAAWKLSQMPDAFDDLSDGVFGAVISAEAEASRWIQDPAKWLESTKLMRRLVADDNAIRAGDDPWSDPKED